MTIDVDPATLVFLGIFLGIGASALVRLFYLWMEGKID